MRQKFLLLIFLILFAASCFARTALKIGNTDAGNVFGISIYNSFEDMGDRQERVLLFGAAEYSSPDSRFYYVLHLYQNGDVFKARIVPNWAVQSSRRAKLDFEQMKEVKRMLAASYFQSPLTSAAPQDNEPYTKINFLNGRDYSNVNYSGALPVEVQKVMDFVKEIINQQQRSIYTNPPKKEDRP